jgi:hypothetical protein
MSTDESTISKVAERLSFFFSDANLRADRFMQKQVGRDDDFGGSITIETLLKFKSIEQHTTDPKVVIEAAKTLDTLLVVDEGEQSVARKDPMKKNQMDENIPLSLYVSNVPVENDKYTVSVSDMRPLFDSYGKVALIKFKWKPAHHKGENKEDENDEETPSKRRNKMIPTGACMVEFETVEELEKAVADLVDGEKKLSIKDQTLEVQRLKDWIDSRKSQRKEKENGGDKDDEENGKDKKRKEVEAAEFTIDWKPGCVIEIKGLDKEKCDRETIRSMVEKAVPGIEGVYADYSRGQEDGAIRFSEPSDVVGKLAQQLNSGEVEIAGTKVGSARVLDGEDEQAYWKRFIDFKTKQMQQRADEKAEKTSKKQRR